MRDVKMASGVAVAVLVVTVACSDPSSTAGSPEATISSEQSSPAPVPTPTIQNPPCEPLPDLPRGRIAYTQSRSDTTSAVYLMKPDGTDKRCLVDTGGPDSFPSWSPDGRWLAFVGGTAEQADIFTVRADGTQLRQVTDNKVVEGNPEWSPGGDQIAYGTSGGDAPPFSVRVMERDGSHDHPVITNGPRFEYVDFTTWAPDGGLLFGADQGRGISLWSMSAEGEQSRLLHAGTGDFGSGAVFSPDGSSVVFQADLNGGCIYRSDTAFRHRVRLTQGCINGFDLTWSTDGEWIMWAGGAHGPADAEVMTSDGRQRHVVVDSGDVAFVDWQPRLAR